MFSKRVKTAERMKRIQCPLCYEYDVKEVSRREVWRESDNRLCGTRGELKTLVLMFCNKCQCSYYRTLEILK